MQRYVGGWEAMKVKIGLKDCLVIVPNDEKGQRQNKREETNDGHNIKERLYYKGALN